MMSWRNCSSISRTSQVKKRKEAESFFTESDAQHFFYCPSRQLAMVDLRFAPLQAAVGGAIKQFFPSRRCWVACLARCEAGANRPATQGRRTPQEGWQLSLISLKPWQTERRIPFCGQLNSLDMATSSLKQTPAPVLTFALAASSPIVADHIRSVSFAAGWRRAVYRLMGQVQE
jgi:hypothetical protein